jgi:predicted lipid carrier protein YhbT
MHARFPADDASSQRQPLLPEILRLLLTPVPLFLLQPILGSIGAHVARARPELFARLGPHARKCYLIDPVDLPFGLALAPDPDNPVLWAYRRGQPPRHDACISGAFIDLFGMIDGALDGDALFFTRALRITGDTEAVVTLRNALDDLDGSIVDDVGGALGIFAKPAGLAIAALRALQARSRNA